VLCVALYECETWSHILTKGYRSQAFENRILRKVFRSEREEVIR
jgi:hypothetical protein